MSKCGDAAYLARIREAAPDLDWIGYITKPPEPRVNLEGEMSAAELRAVAAILDEVANESTQE